MSVILKPIGNKILNLKNHPLLLNYKDDKISPLIKTFFTSFFNSLEFSDDQKSKYTFFMETYSEKNIFLNERTREEFAILFSKIQKVYNALNRFAFLYKYKKAHIVVDRDMTLNDIVENDKNILAVVQEGSKYLFHVNDLVNIINASLTNSYLFFAEPLFIKNPYNNLAFNKSTLYNIYFYIKFNTKLYPELIIKYFYTNFDLTMFLFQNETILREYSIKNYVMKSPSNIIHKEIIIMIKRFNKQYRDKTRKILIHRDFPANKLIKIMKPYLLLYLSITYSLIPIVKAQSEVELTCRLTRFQKFSPDFGKKTGTIFVASNTNEITSHDIFIDNHIPFNNDDNFITSHLSVNTAKYYYGTESLNDFNHMDISDEEDEDEDEDDEYFDNFS